jgi:hypothetical protein
MTDSEDCRNVQVGVNVKDSYHCSNMYLKPELCYETLGTIEAYHCAYCLYVFYSQNMLYSEHCYYCHDCFGCSGLTRKQYCIFNKQYSKEEYEALVPQIIERMKASGEFGLFFPPRFSSFGYNESVAQEYMPLTKDEATSRGFHWRTQHDEPVAVSSLMETDTLPDSIRDVTDDITTKAIACAETKRPFRILKSELDFYRNQQIPLPRLHPSVRYSERMTLRNQRRLYERTCMKCGKDVQTTFAPDRTEKIFCEQCYLETVY